MKRMKNNRLKITVSVILLLIANIILAQNKPFQFGFKAGLNLGWYNSINDDYKNKGLDIGGSWGFAADFFVMENYSVTTGFDVLYHNGTLNYPEYYSISNNVAPELGVLTRKYKTKYIKIPVVFTMKTNEINNIKYYGQIGVGIGFLLTAKSNDEFVADGTDNSTSASKNIYDEMRFTRESVILGAGIEMPVYKSTKARIGLMYDNAFINILKGNNGLDPTTKNNGRSSYIELTATLLF